ncbi:MAG: antibiotic biosynthesis monooxygenase family protein [Lysobacterales bacterium]
MIIRIVQMEFEEKLIQDFLKIFAASREKIRSFPGCTHLQLLQGEADPGVFFTYSHWDGEDDLDAYRNSELFRKVWRNTRKLFRAAPKAWSLADKTEVIVQSPS